MRITQADLLRKLRAADRSAALELLDAGRGVGARQVGGKVSVSIRLPMPLADSGAVTLFVVTHKRGGETYTYWLDHWPRAFNKAKRRYQQGLESVFGSRVIGAQAAKHVALSDARERMPRLKPLLQRLITDLSKIEHRQSTKAGLDESLGGLEGEVRKRMIRHRKREARLRADKIRDCLRRGQALACEVETCRVDFEERYGDLGRDYIQVHHMKPLADRTRPQSTPPSDLRLVCPNCHAMIHRGGACRTLRAISRAIRRARERCGPNKRLKLAARVEY